MLLSRSAASQSRSATSCAHNNTTYAYADELAQKDRNNNIFEIYDFFLSLSQLRVYVQYLTQGRVCHTI